MDWTDDEATPFAAGLSRGARAALQAAIAAVDPAVAPPEGRWLNVRPDPPDFRDRPYRAGFTALPAELLPDPALADLAVRDQGHLSACTGMATAVAVDLIRARLWRAQGARGNRPPPVSARMLYEMGRAFDEFEDGLPGSSIRGVLRGFFHNGVARELAERDGPDAVPELVPWPFSIDRAKDARGCLLGVYARLAHVLLDYHVALAEVGAVVVSTQLHAGWAIGGRLADGHIAWTGREALRGGHAVAIVGYTADGFLIRNSWGADWSVWRDATGRDWPGVALWRYDDWQAHVMDAWVLNLAPPTAGDARASGGHFRGGGGAPGRQPARIAVNGHYVYLRDGRLNTRGTFHNSLDSLGQTAALLADSQNYDHLLVMVEAGLDGVAAMAARAARLIAPLKARRIYPVFVWWREDVLDLTAEILEDRARRLAPRTGGVPAIADRLLASFARDFMPPIWRSYTIEAERALAGTGEGWQALKTLLDGALRNETPLKLHLAAHSAGAIWLAGLLARLTGWAPLPGRHPKTGMIATLSLIAPIAGPAAFEGAVRRLWQPSGDGDPTLGLYTAATGGDRRERVGGYRGSFLDLAVRSFPEDAAQGRLLPILGAPERVAALMADAEGPWPADSRWWPADAIGARCDHPGLIADPALLAHLVERILDTGPARDRALRPPPLDLPPV